MIQDGQKFIGPVELIKHHRDKLDGFLTKPTIPCERPPGYPLAWPGVTYHELETALYDFAERSNLKVKTSHFVELTYIYTVYLILEFFS